MTVDDAVGSTAGDEQRKRNRYHFDRHQPEYRGRFQEITTEMHDKYPLAWSDTYGGHWVAAGAREVFELARSAENLSNDHDVRGERKGYQGISIPSQQSANATQGGFLEMDPPKQRYYRQTLNPYLSPAAVNRWVPFIDEVTRACIDEKIESGRIDFVDDLANIVPAVLTLAMLGVPIERWTVYCEPTHAAVYTPPNTPEMAAVRQQQLELGKDLGLRIQEVRQNPRPGLIDALLRAEFDEDPPDDRELMGVLALVIGGGFDTTTALTAHSLEWLGEHPDERARLSRERETLLDSATEEFLRFYTPAPGDGRTFSQDCVIADQEFKEGERLWLSWAMANRDPSLFDNPHQIDLARKGNRHHSFGLGIHRCIGSNVARTVFKRMMTAVLDRMPDYACDPEGAVHYPTIGVIQGMRNLPAHFTPGERLGAGLDETLAKLQTVVDEQRLAEPITRKKQSAKIDR